MASSSQAATQKKSKGRQKVKIEKMENESNLQVTFSKRRAGLFKKASELCTRCGVEAGIIVFSPAKKVFSFGHPSVEIIFNRLMNGPAPGPANISLNEMIMEAHRDSNIRGLNLELTQLESQVAMEKKRLEDLELAKKIGQIQGWFPPAIEEFNYEQLDVFGKTILNFQKHFDEETKQAMMLANGNISSSSVVIRNDENAPAPGFSFASANAPVPFPQGFNSVTTGFGDTTGLYATQGINVANSFGAYQQAPYDPTVLVPPGVVDPAYGVMTGGELSSSRFFVGGSSSLAGPSMLPPTDGFMAPGSGGLGPYGGFDELGPYGGFDDGSGLDPFGGLNDGIDLGPYDGLDDGSGLGPYGGLDDGSGLGPYGGLNDGSGSGHI